MTERTHVEKSGFIAYYDKSLRVTSGGVHIGNAGVCLSVDCRRVDSQLCA